MPCRRPEGRPSASPYDARRSSSRLRMFRRSCRCREPAGSSRGGLVSRSVSRRRRLRPRRQPCPLRARARDARSVSSRTEPAGSRSRAPGSGPGAPAANSAEPAQHSSRRSSRRWRGNRLRLPGSQQCECDTSAFHAMQQSQAAGFRTSCWPCSSFETSVRHGRYRDAEPTRRGGPCVAARRKVLQRGQVAETLCALHSGKPAIRPSLRALDLLDLYRVRRAWVGCAWVGRRVSAVDARRTGQTSARASSSSVSAWRSGFGNTAGQACAPWRTQAVLIPAFAAPARSQACVAINVTS